MPRPAPLLAWIMLNLAVLALAACSPYTGARLHPSQSAALTALYTTTLLAIALLFPLLLPDRQTALAATVVVWPFFQLAGFLATAPQQQILFASAALTLYLAAASLFSTLLHSSPARQSAVAVSATLFLGVPLLAYLQADTPGPIPQITLLTYLNPLTIAPGHTSLIAAAIQLARPAALLLVAIVAVALRPRFAHSARTASTKLPS